MEAYTELFSIAEDRNAFVAGLMSRGNGMLHWDLTFTRSMFRFGSWSLSSFMDLLYSILVQGMGEDTICWGFTITKDFPVKRYYSCFEFNPL